MCWEFQFPEGLITDPQLRGRAQRLMASKAIYKPARPLKAKELAALEKAMVSDLDVRDIYMLGAIIFCSTVQIQVVGPEVCGSVLG